MKRLIAKFFACSGIIGVIAYAMYEIVCKLILLEDCGFFFTIILTVLFGISFLLAMDYRKIGEFFPINSFFLSFHFVFCIFFKNCVFPIIFLDVVWLVFNLYVFEFFDDVQKSEIYLYGRNIGRYRRNMGKYGKNIAKKMETIKSWNEKDYNSIIPMLDKFKEKQLDFMETIDLKKKDGSIDKNAIKDLNKEDEKLENELIKLLGNYVYFVIAERNNEELPNKELEGEGERIKFNINKITGTYTKLISGLCAYDAQCVDDG